MERFFVSPWQFPGISEVPSLYMITIKRFLANEFGLAGKNSIEMAQANEVVDAVNDLFEARVINANRLVFYV